jgi:hypothetical protein
VKRSVRLKGSHVADEEENDRTPERGRGWCGKGSKVLFTSKKTYKIEIVILLFLFNKYYLIID